MHSALAATRRRVLADERTDIVHVEAGAWRVRLEDLLRVRPDLAEEVAALAASAPR
jgi:hypothetical protein